MIEACFKAFARALRVAVSVDPDENGVPSTKGSSGMTARICILDYGMGNLRSVEKALEHVGATATIANDAATVRAADGLILPGVGAFPKAMERVRELGLDELNRERATPARRSSASASACSCCSTRPPSWRGRGIGLLAGGVDVLDAEGLKVPHIGWSPVRWEKPSRLVEGIESETPFYFVHSFAPSPEGDLLGSAAYGARFACAAERDNVFGVQFHPEKSSGAGLRLLANFAGVCSAVPA